MEKAYPLDNLAIVARLREACGVEKDAQLARLLGQTTSAVSTWKTAINAPFKACFDVHMRTGITMEWLLKGFGPKYLPEEDSVKGSSVKESSAQEKSGIQHEKTESLDALTQPDPALSITHGFFVKAFTDTLDMGNKMRMIPKWPDESTKHFPHLASLLYSDTIELARNNAEQALKDNDDEQSTPN